MPKRPPKGYGSSTIDVFDDDIGRAADALAAATAPVAPAPAEPAPTVERVEKEPPLSKANVVSMPPASERQEAETAEQPERTPVRRAAAKTKTRAASPEKTTEAPAQELTRVPEKNVGLKFRVPQSVKSDFQTFMAELSAALGGVSLDDSNVGRPILEILLLEHRERILQAAKNHRGELTRPTNRDVVAMAEFDEALGTIIREGVSTRRRAPGGKARE